MVLLMQLHLEAHIEAKRAVTDREPSGPYTLPIQGHTILNYLCLQGLHLLAALLVILGNCPDGGILLPQLSRDAAQQLLQGLVHW